MNGAQYLTDDRGRGGRYVPQPAALAPAAARVEGEMSIEDLGDGRVTLHAEKAFFGLFASRDLAVNQARFFGGKAK